MISDTSKVSVKTLIAVISLCVAIVFGIAGLFVGRATVFVELAKMNITIQQHGERIRDLESTRAMMVEKFCGMDDKFLNNQKELQAFRTDVQRQLDEIKQLIRNKMIATDGGMNP